MSRTLTPLTDEQMAILVDLADDHTRAEIAQALSASYFAVHKAVQRVRARDWAVRLVYVACAVCGRPVVSATTARRKVCVSSDCRRLRINARARRRGEDHPGQSTPYVRAWRGRNPGKVLAARIRETDRWRGKPHVLTPEQKQRHNAVANRGQKAKNERTRELADNHGQAWSSDDDQYIVDHQIETNTALAYTLGRTAHAVHHRRTFLRKRGVLGSPELGLLQ